MQTSEDQSRETNVKALAFKWNPTASQCLSCLNDPCPTFVFGSYFQMTLGSLIHSSTNQTHWAVFVHPNDEFYSWWLNNEVRKMVVVRAHPLTHHPRRGKSSSLHFNTHLSAGKKRKPTSMPHNMNAIKTCLCSAPPPLRLRYRSLGR